MAQRTTLNVSLTPELGRFIESRIRSGRYQTASEVVREALRLLEERSREPLSSLGDLREEIEAGLEQLRRGETVDGEEFFEAIAERRRAAR